MPLELPQRVQFRKQQKQQVIWLGKDYRENYKGQFKEYS